MKAIADLRPYPTMKDSGLPWCPEIPAHWDLKLNRDLLRQRRDIVGDKHSEYTLLSLTKKGIIVRDLSTNKGKFSSNMRTSQQVRQGDLVMCLFDVPETPRTVGVSYHDGMITSAYTVFKAKDPKQGRWLEKFYIAMDDRKLLSPLYSGLRNTIPKKLFLRHRTPTPPFEEQISIVRYLDYVDQRVRRVMAAKRKLIALLDELKQATIHRAVTRGLDPSVPMKDSGVEWLGEIPEHWEVQRLKTSIRGSFGGIWGSDPNDIDDLLCVRVADFDRQSFRVRTPIVTTRAITPKERRRRMLKCGDLLLEKSGGGERQPVGTVVLFDHAIQTVCSNFIVRMPVCSEFDPEFLTYLHSMLYAIGINIISIKQTTGIQNLDLASYLTEKVAFPPFSEQIAITEYLNHICKEIDAISKRTTREIELLEELRTRLVSDVVTGQLDVREAAGDLPETDPLEADLGDLDADLEEVEV